MVNTKAVSVRTGRCIAVGDVADVTRRKRIEKREHDVAFARLLQRRSRIGFGVGTKSHDVSRRSAYASQAQVQIGVRHSRYEKKVSVTRRCRRQDAYRGRVWAVMNPKSFFQQALRVGKDAVDFGASLVPEKVPRPVARVGVTILSAVTILSLVKTVLSTAVTIMLLGILGWKAVMNDTTNSGSGGSNAGSSTDKREIDGGEEDPLEEARRIMSKYK